MYWAEYWTPKKVFVPFLDFCSGFWLPEFLFRGLVHFWCCIKWT